MVPQGAPRGPTRAQEKLVFCHGLAGFFGDPWALGTPGPWDPLGLGGTWWALGTLGPWGSLGLGDPWAPGGGYNDFVSRFSCNFSLIESLSVLLT